TMPLLTASIAVLSRRIAKKTARAQNFYAEAGAVAEEVLSAMKTVVAFGAEKRETERYGAKLVAARDGEVKAGFHSGVMTGIILLCIFFTYALVFWYGGKLIYDGTNNSSTGEPYDGGNVITIYFACIMATFALGQIAPNISFFIEG
ncbi:(ABC) transporter, partial [Perkinsus olseni]